MIRECRHTLHDADGTPLFVHARTYGEDGDKHVWWEQLDGTRGLAGVKAATLPLYGIHELDGAREVIVTEGEPARDALAAIGIPAVGIVVGAPATACTESFRPLLGVDTIYLWPDPDEAGQQQHARNLARLREIEHPDVRVIVWPQAPDKGDAVDLIATGGTAEDVRGLMDAATLVSNRDDAGIDAPTGAQLVVQWMSEVESKPIDWIWPRWLAKGKLHLLGGVGGIGKGTIMAEIAAQLSTGKGHLPDGTAAPFVKSLFLLSEDAPDDTFSPRLDIHGADKRHVGYVAAVVEPDGANRTLSLARHVSPLEAAVVAHDIGLVVVDALSDFMPGADRNSEGEVRDILTPLADMARRTGVAILGVMHPGKGNAELKAFQRLLGASAFGNVARCVWLAVESPDRDGRNLLGVDKSNLAVKPPTLSWSRAEDAPIVWHGPSEHSIGDVFGSSSAKPRDDAEGFLRELLAGGSVQSSRVEALAKAAGISWATTRRAADTLNVERYRPKGEKNPPWFWRLPSGAPLGDRHESDRTSCSQLEMLR